MSQSLTSSHFPYVPLHLQMGHRDADVEALLDTGFDASELSSNMANASSWSHNAHGSPELVR